ncbi:hypothetical protein HNP31_000522 [Acinetobacter johnsonii]|uniref:hypothetical protein n=1 Tax=Acinetobacter johnsonii TaxID=40214 RepID=UPI00161846BD|nr:hypothetical protein [Acinetobacter johnsonii]MBB4808836.1 hypothetical protein [Acinetobacter johnsonii]
MIDILLKLLPIIVALGPLFVWLDKAQRFSHRRKFYAKRIEEVKAYISKYYKKDVQEIEKDCAAQLLVGSEKVGHLEVDYVIENYPQRFFLIIEDVITARKFIKIKNFDEEPTFVTYYKKPELVKLMIKLAVGYFLSLLILYLNDILVAILTWLPFVNPIPVNSSIYFLGFLFSLSLFILVISSIWIFFWSADATLNIYEKLNVKYINRSE